MASAVDKLAAVTSVPERRDVNFALSNVTLVDEQDQQLNWHLMDSLTSAQVELSMSQASTVTLQFEDADYDFLDDPVLAKWAFGIVDVSTSSGRNFSTHKITAATNNINAGMNSDMEWVLGQRPIDLYLDTIAFRMCAIHTQRTLLTLSFEDRAASLLRDKKGFKTAERGTVTRAQFVKMLCNEAGVDFFIPEADVVQPISTDTQIASQSGSGATTVGLTTAMGITVKGIPATQSQIDILNTALQTAVSLKAPGAAQIALVEALIAENDVANPNPGDSGDEGCLSITASTARSLPFSPYDVAASCHWFLMVGFTGYGGAIGQAQANPKATPYEIAQAVQGSGAGAATNGASNYGVWEGEATSIVQAYHGKGGVFGASSAPVPAPYAFTRGPNEDSWDCIQRLASEVGWYAFVREGRLWYASGDYLFSQGAQLNVARGENGIDYVDVDLDMGARDQISEVTVTGRTHLWTGLPGMTVQVNNRGPANGKWSIDGVELDLLDDANGCTITLRKPLPARPEPASTKTTNALGGITGSKGTVQAAYQAAQQLSNMGLPYVWGGHHGPGALATVSASGGGLDCSSSTSWVLYQAGMFSGNSALVSGEFASSWGQPGEGQTMTVWANAGHVWIEFKLPGQHMQMNTVSPGDVGPRLYPYGPPGGNPAGFTPRHWPGT